MIYAVNGHAHGLSVIPGKPLIDATSASNIAARNTKMARIDPASVGLIYFMAEDDQVYLVYKLRLVADNVDELVYVDAISGEVVARHSLIQSAKSRSIYTANYGVSLPGTLLRYEGGPAASDSVANDNYATLGVTYDYYNVIFGRDSYDDSGASMVSSIHYYINYNNAGWSSFYQQMIYGDGDGYTFSNLASCLDVTGHELTHAVTERTSGLVYALESGALNEGISDIFGAMIETYSRGGVVDSKTWKIGEDAYTPYVPGDALRYMDDPAADGYSRGWYPDRLTVSSPDSSNDYGWVHYNSGIANLAFKLMVTGGTHPRGKSPWNVPAQGYDHAQRIFYRANTLYLQNNSTFEDARAATALAASDLYGLSAYTDTQIAWDAVGVPHTTGNALSVNFSTRAHVGTGNDILIGGFVLGGGGSSKPMLVRAIGPTLATMGVAGVIADPQLTLKSGSTTVDYNDNWGSSSSASAIATTSAAVGAFPLNSSSLDAVVLPTLGSGAYTSLVSGVSGGTGNGMIEIYDTDSTNANHLVNMSARFAINGSDPTIAGLVLKGDEHKKLLIRVGGPALGGLGVPDPKITLYHGSIGIRTNDDWGDEANAADIAAAANAVGASAYGSGSADSAMLIELPPGIYTAMISGNGGTGLALVEVYEVN
jgi:vibriolysin